MSTNNIIRKQYNYVYIQYIIYKKIDLTHFRIFLDNSLYVSSIFLIYIYIYVQFNEFPHQSNVD